MLLLPMILAAACASLSVNVHTMPTVDPVERLAKTSSIHSLMERIKEVDNETLIEQRAIAEIPAPTFKEQERAIEFLRRLKELGLTNAHTDTEGNVIALRKGTGSGNAPTLVLSAHLDTVFPEGSDVTVKERNGKLYGRGLADDSRGLAVLLTIARLLEQEQLRTVGDILFVGTVGEEGSGNLRGVRALFRDNSQIDGFISVDGINLIAIVNGATAVRRWHVTFEGAGGHSFLNFGTPSAVHAMGRAIAAISDLQPPANPATTFTVGIATGGTSVNAIAAKAAMDIDIRSNETAPLRKLENQIMAAIDAAASAEGQRWDAEPVKVTRKLTGDRPGGITPESSPIIRASLAAARATGGQLPFLVRSATDSNIPIGAGIPAVTLPGGGQGGNFHSPDEWYRNVDAWRGVQRVALTVLSLVGVEGVAAPMLEKRQAADVSH